MTTPPEEKKVEIIDPNAKTEEPQGKKKVWQKILSIGEWVLIGALLIFDIFVISMRFSTNTGRGTNFFGNEIFIVQTGSMEGSQDLYDANPDWEIKDCPIDSAVFVQDAPATISEGDSQETIEFKQQMIDAYYGDIKVGDVMTFYYQVGTTVIVTHRVTAINIIHGQYGNVYRFTLRGDNPTGDKVVSAYSPTQTVQSDTGMVIGKVTRCEVGLGKFIVHFIQNKVLMGVLIIAPAGIMFVYEIAKIIVILQRSKEQARQEAQNNEVNELKEKLEQLQQQEPKKDKLAELREYKAMLDEGLITQEEYDQKKKELLG